MKTIFIFSLVVYSVSICAQGSITINISSNSYLCNVPCSGSAIATVTGGVPPYHYHWSPGNIISDTAKNLCAGVYKVMVTDSLGDTDTATVNIAPTIFCSDTLITASDSASICVLQNFTSYLWNEYQDTTKCMEAKEAGGYWVTVTDQNNCTAVSNPVQIAICPVPDVSVLVNGDTFILFQPTPPCVIYSWYRNDTLVSQSDSFFIGQQPGNYSLQIYYSCTCTAADSLLSTDYVWDAVISGVGNLKEQDDINVYPNPTNDIWQLELDGSLLQSEMEIYDMEGRKVYQSIISSLKSTIVANYALGVYILYIHSPAGTLQKRLVKL